MRKPKRPAAERARGRPYNYRGRLQSHVDGLIGGLNISRDAHTRAMRNLCKADSLAHQTAAIAAALCFSDDVVRQEMYVDKVLRRTIITVARMNRSAQLISGPENRDHTKAVNACLLYTSPSPRD